jgi:hypothetical protein
MKKNDSAEAFTHYVFSKIDPEIRKSLTESQFKEIKEAISAATPLKKHPVDIRHTIPLFFFRFYFVFLMGRDRRSKTKNLEFNRRKSSNTIFGSIFLIIVFLPLLIMSFLILYYIKSKMGIDIFDDFHLIDFFK